MTLSAIVNGITYPLDDGTYCYWVGDDGLGMAPMRRLSERGPLQHGDTDRGYRLDPRMIRLVLDVVATTRASLFSKRQSLLSIFSPLNPKVVLQLELDSRTYRIDTNYVAQMAMPSSERLGWNQTVVVDLKANDPTFYQATGNSVTFTLGAGLDKHEVPTVIPMTLGGTDIVASIPITYTGTFPTSPIIRIYGPVTSPIITNSSTGDKLDFTGITIVETDYYTIDTRYGRKTVASKVGTNKLSELSNDSDLATFALMPDPEVGGGINAITIFGYDANTVTKIDVNWNNRYIGI